MRVIINQKKVRRNRRLAQYAFFGTLALLILGLFVTNIAPTNPLFLLAPLLVLPVAFGATLYSVRMANLWLREPRPEAVLATNLKGLSTRSTIYHYTLPARHVLISPQGVFCFILRPQDGSFVINGNRWSKKGSFLSKFLTFFRQDTIGRPDLEALREATTLQRLIDQVAPESDVRVEPVIIFSSPSVSLEVVQSDIPVLYGDPRQKPNLKTFLRDRRKQGEVATLTDEQIAALEATVGVDVVEQA